ncbi:MULTISPECIES: PLP-dependent aminotransferase family protein [Actinomycetes]|uniref:aminotransferase-like domain-containing protein n=1 Tax=Actinomycetes TaxID=1760 RepID=UPI0031D28D04
MTDSSSRVEQHLRRWIEQAPVGARLPSSRRLVSELQVSPVTVQTAVRRLVGLGLVESRPGVGTFVRPRRPAASRDHRWQTAALSLSDPVAAAAPATLRSASPEAIPLHVGYPEPGLLPRRLLQSAWSRAGRTDSSLQRPPAAGLPELQAWFAQELMAAEAGGAGISARDVLIVPGSQSGLVAVFRALIGRDQPLVMESPTYWGAILAARHIGARIIPVPTGPHGPDPEQVRQALIRSGARTFYAQPTFANPTGAQWSPARGREILDVVRDQGAFLIEDDYAHDFGIDGAVAPLAAQDPDGHVVHLRSLTKSLSPSVRVAAVVAHGPARERILRACQAESLYVSAVLQSVALDVVTQPGWSTHRRGLREELGRRRDLLVRAVHQHMPDAQLEYIPRGGLHLWLHLPDLPDVGAFVRRCEEKGVVVAGGDEWFPAEAPAGHVRISYCGPRTEEFDEAGRLMGEALRECLEDQR